MNFSSPAAAGDATNKVFMFTTGYPHQGAYIPVQHWFYHPNQVLCQQPTPVAGPPAVNQPQPPSIGSSNVSQQAASNASTASLVFEGNPSETRTRDLPPPKAPLASDIVKGVASAPKTAATTASIASSGAQGIGGNDSSAISGSKKDVNTVISHDGNMQQQISMPSNQGVNQNVSESSNNMSLIGNSGSRLDASIDQSGLVIAQSSAAKPSTSLIQTTQMIANSVMPYKFGVVNAAEGPLNTQNTLTPQIIQAIQHARNPPMQHMSHRLAQLDYGAAAASNLVPSHLVMSPGYQKQGGFGQPLVTHIPLFVENPNALTDGAAAAMPNLISNQLSITTVANTLHCSNCGKQGHLSHDCGEKTINGILNYG